MTVSEHTVKRAAVLEILDASGREAVVLRSPAALGWYLGGARSHVSLAAPPVLSIRVDRHSDTAFVTSNEAERLAAEELPAGVELSCRRWFEAPPEQADAVEEATLADELRAARARLLPGEQERFRDLARDCARAASEVLQRVRPTDSEWSVAAMTAHALLERGVDPLVVLVGGDSRPAHRHPLPTAAPIGSRAMLVVCGRRHGLIADITRWVRFGARSPAEADRDLRILAVESAFLRALIPGSTLADVLAAGSQAYAEHGFDADEWTRHHQGGAAGYDGRDPRATPTTADRVVVGGAYAWNPTAPGPAKVEDTVLLTEAGIEVLSVDPEWPTVPVDGLERPDVLVRPAR